MNKTDEFIETSVTKTNITRQQDFHAHLHNHAEMIYAMVGGFKAIVENQEYIVSEGSLIVIFPYQVHSYRKIDSKAALIMLYNPMNERILQDKFSTMKPESNLISSDKLTFEMKMLLNFLIKQYYQYSPLRGYISESYKSALWGLILNTIDLCPVKGGNNDTFSMIKEWCNKSFTMNIGLSDASRELGFSESTISHMFAERLGLGFREYINYLRIQQAKECLLNTRQTILDISYSCGFNSLSTFNRVFKKIIGMTPNEYRRE